ncbi:MAG: rubrerythrin family protein [Chloroflexi bacterium]|nr:rubrerythrin family protein [Chloroflexota bacterium]
MRDMTKANVLSAYSGESQAHMRYAIWSDKAAKDGFANVARLFRAVSHSEKIHAKRHFMAVADSFGAADNLAGAGFGYGETLQNLEVAVGGEEFEIAEMYPVYKAVADLQAEKFASVGFFRALEAEKVHAAMFHRAIEAAKAGKDVELGPIHVCPDCGFTMEGDAPDRCPVCGEPKANFVTYA